MSYLSGTWTDVNRAVLRKKWGVACMIHQYTETSRLPNTSLPEFECWTSRVYSLPFKLADQLLQWLEEESFVLDCRLCSWNHLNLKDMTLLAACCPALPSSGLPARQPFPAQGCCCSGGSECLEVFWESSRAITSLACEQILPEEHKEQKVNGNFQKSVTQPSFNSISCQKWKLGL